MSWSSTSFTNLYPGSCTFASIANLCIWQCFPNKQPPKLVLMSANGPPIKRNIDTRIDTILSCILEPLCLFEHALNKLSG